MQSGRGLHRAVVRGRGRVSGTLGAGAQALPPQAGEKAPLHAGFVLLGSVISTVSREQREKA